MARLFNSEQNEEIRRENEADRSRLFKHADSNLRARLSNDSNVRLYGPSHDGPGSDMPELKRPLKILHIDTERTWRGGQQQVFWLLRGLIERGHQNTTVVWQGGDLEKRLATLTTTVFSLRPFGELDLISAYRLNRFIKKEGFDVVHAHSGHAVALGRLALLGSHIPLVITRRVDFKLSRNIFSKWKYRGVSVIISISNGVTRALLESGIRKSHIVPIPSGIPVTPSFKRSSAVSTERIVKVPDGIPLDRHLFTVKALKSEMGVPDDGIVIGQVAALAPHKDQATFLEGVRRLLEREPLVHAVLVGDGPLKSELKQRAQQLGIEDHVHFLGFKNEPLNFLSAFDIFCLSSKEEGLGTSLLDAMALGIPIVATNVGGIPDVIEDNVTGILVPPKDPSALAEAIQKLMKNPELRTSLATAATERVKDFDINQTIQRTEDVYYRVLINTVSPPA